MVMVHVPGGTFQMGSDESDLDAWDDQFPQHSVTLDGFWIDQTEVTNAQFATFLSNQGNQAEGGLTWLDQEDEDCLIEQSGGEFRPKGGYGDHPVTQVSWHGAEAYCEWVGARLPTEAEWEYAARGSGGLIYPWGDDFDCSRGNFDDETSWDVHVAGYEGCDGYERTAPVGSFPTGMSWCNALDMAGNVWEWVADWYGGYPSEAQTNPAGPPDGDGKVLRGGGWTGHSLWVRAAYRGRNTAPDPRSFDAGFRCADQPGE
jgi:serine/threonine-protein kinase